MLEGCTKTEKFLSVTCWLELYRHVHKFIFACSVTLYIVVSKWREPSALNRAACLVAASHTMPGKHQPSSELMCSEQVGYQTDSTSTLTQKHVNCSVK